MKRLSKSTIEVINDLKNDLDSMLRLESNIEVAWALEKLNQDADLIKSADHIRKMIKCDI